MNWRRGLASTYTPLKYLINTATLSECSQQNFAYHINNILLLIMAETLAGCSLILPNSLCHVRVKFSKRPFLIILTKIFSCLFLKQQMLRKERKILNNKVVICCFRQIRQSVCDSYWTSTSIQMTCDSNIHRLIAQGKWKVGVK